MGLNQAYQLDDLDLQILDILIKDCRTPYLEIARLCHVSGGTIHVRMKKNGRTRYNKRYKNFIKFT